jgi:cobaltochelatase CobN
VIVLLSTSDTDLLSARASGADYRLGNPNRTDLAALSALLDGATAVVIRILGGYRAWENGIDAVLASGVPAIVLGGEAMPDAELMRLSTVAGGIVAEAHAYLAHGGPENLGQLARFLSDAIALTGEGFEPPKAMPTWGLLERAAVATDGPTVGILYYRAHQLAGNVDFVHALADAVEAAGGRALPVFCSSLRTAEPELTDALRAADTIVVTVLAAGGSLPASVSAGGTDEDWDVGALASLDVPIVQGLCLTSSRKQWLASADGLTPLDAATQIAIPEFDGRLITVPFSFKEVGEDGLTRYVPDPERAARVAAIAVKHARLRHLPPGERRIVLMLSAYPTKHARIGNAVGLDTPASTVRLLAAMGEAGYEIGDALPTEGDALMHALIIAGGQDENWLTEAQLAGNPVRINAADYRAFFDTLDPDLRDNVIEHWGQAPGQLFVDRSHDPDGEIVLAALRSGNVVVMVQPPRGFGAKPVSIYHDPDLPPSHHYLATYHWIREQFGAHAVVHVGKHGNLEWLPGKTAGLSAACSADAAIGDIPLVYPFLVNDPGEGTQAKRRVHATLVDHLVPPMARAESYGDIARLEQLLDEHAQIAALDPAKLPAIRAQIWTLMQAAKLDHDLGVADRPHDAEFDDFVLHVDGWLCEIKDAQIRDGLHILGNAPPARRESTSFSRSCVVGRCGPGRPRRCRVCEKRSATSSAPTSEPLPTPSKHRPELWSKRWRRPPGTRLPSPQTCPSPCVRCSRSPRPRSSPGWPARPRRSRGCCTLSTVATSPPGRAARRSEGLVNVLPTGRNFYSVDPRAVPSRLAWDTGQAMADSLLERYLADTGGYPESVGLSIWGTAAMRTSGDDVAEVLALLGVRPVWDEASRRISSLEPIPLDELGRPRIDVTVRISGFFRDAFPHVVTMLDDAVHVVATLDEPAEQNYVRAHAQADLIAHRRRTPSYHAHIRQQARCLRGRTATAHRRPQLARRRRPRRGLRGMGRLRLRPRTRRTRSPPRYGDLLPAHRGRGAQLRHSRT